MLASIIVLKGSEYLAAPALAMLAEYEVRKARAEEAVVPAPKPLPARRQSQQYQPIKRNITK